MNIATARTIPLADFISQLGHERVEKGRQNEAWFKSPFRREKTASFKVDVQTNKWKDFAESYPKGDIIDFVKAYSERTGGGTLTTSETLKRIASITGRDVVATQRQQRTRKRTESIKPVQPAQPTFRIDRIGPIRAPQLIDYLRNRKLLVGNAKEHIMQVHYTHLKIGKQFYGLTWENVQGGNEVRSPNFKTVIGTKAPSLLVTNNPKAVPGTAVFEGMTDYLSYLQINKRELMRHAIVMNSAALHRETVTLLNQRPADEPVHGYLQNDHAGLAAAMRLTEAVPRLQLHNHKYAAYNDLNDYLTGKPLTLQDKRTVAATLARDFGGPRDGQSLSDGKPKQSI